MSQEVVKDVRTGGKVIGQCTVTVFDNMDEAEETLGGEEILSMVNRQRTIELMDARRRELTGGAPTGIRAIMAKAKTDPELLAKIKELVGEI